jgi:hypothetical protein
VAVKVKGEGFAVNANFVVIYRWRVHPDKVEQFRHAWRGLTERIYRYRGSCGSRLLLDETGAYVAIALWPSRALWEAMRPALPQEDEFLQLLLESISESTPAQLLNVLEDCWAPPLGVAPEDGGNAG